MRRSISFPALFLLAVFVSLFFGDGGQALVDVYWAGILATIGIYLYIKRAFFRPFPRSWSFLWLFLIGYFAARTLFSDSVGYSVTATMRILMGFVSFYLAFTTFQNGQLRSFCRYLLWLVFAAIGISFFFILLPQLASFLPPTNLLFANYGHNHLVQLLLLVLPLTLYRLYSGNNWQNWVWMFILLMAIILSFSRGAYLVVSGYFIYELGKSLRRKSNTLNHSRQVVRIILVFTGISIITLFIVQTLLVQTLFFPQFAWLKRQNDKPVVWTVRTVYWQQALDAIKDNPLLGHGPGTFPLLSKRYQLAPEQHSLYAHSFFFEQLAEVGVIGVGLWFLIFYALFQHAYTYILKPTAHHSPHTTNHLQPTTYNLQLFSGVVLVFIYAQIDFTFNFLTIWILWWGILGMLVNLSKKSAT